MITIAYSYEDSYCLKVLTDHISLSNHMLQIEILYDNLLNMLKG